MRKNKVIKIKKGNLNYDQSGRAYPDNPEVKENWNCIWEYDGKYYKLVGDGSHKEWDEVQIPNPVNNLDKLIEQTSHGNKYHFYSKSNLFGTAISYSYIDEDGNMWVGNEEYESQVNFCPWTGTPAPKQMDILREGVSKLDNRPFKYFYREGRG